VKVPECKFVTPTYPPPSRGRYLSVTAQQAAGNCKLNNVILLPCFAEKLNELFLKKPRKGFQIKKKGVLNALFSLQFKQKSLLRFKSRSFRPITSICVISIQICMRPYDRTSASSNSKRHIRTCSQACIDGTLCSCSRCSNRIFGRCTSCVSRVGIPCNNFRNR